MPAPLAQPGSFSAPQPGACTNSPVGDSQTPSQKEKKGTKSPNSVGSQWDHFLLGSQRLDRQHCQDQHIFGSLHPSTPLGFPTSRMLQEVTLKAQKFCPEGPMPKGTSNHLEWVPRKPVQRSWRVFVSGSGAAGELLLTAFSRMTGVCTAKPGGGGSCQAGTCAAARAVG